MIAALEHRYMLSLAHCAVGFASVPLTVEAISLPALSS